MPVRVWSASVALGLAAAAAHAASIAPGDLVVLQSVDDASFANETAVPVTLTEFASAPGSAPVQTVAVPSSGDARLTVGASTGTEGLLTYNDGYIGIAGYDADPGTASVFRSAANATRRMLAYDVTQDLSAGPQLNATTTINNSGNFRSALYSQAAGGFYGVGGFAGIVFQPNGGTDTGTNILTGGSALYSISIQNGDIYAYQGSGSHGVYKVNGTPTTTDNTQSIFVATPQSTNNGRAVTGFNFWMSPDQSVVYLAEDTDTASAANGGLPTGGIKKYLRQPDETYALAYTISTDYDGAGDALTGVKSISVDDSGAFPLIYATTSDRQVLLSLSDTGTAEGASSTLSVLQTAASGSFIRSVVFIPHLPGDTDDSGTLTPDDYALLDRGFNRYLAGQIATGQAIWSDGDFNRDGAVDSADYLILDTHYAANHTLSPDLLNLRASQFGPDYVAALTAAVPEPGPLATLAIIGLSAACLTRRRSQLATRRPVVQTLAV